MNVLRVAVVSVFFLLPANAGADPCAERAWPEIAACRADKSVRVIRMDRDAPSTVYIRHQPSSAVDESAQSARAQASEAEAKGSHASRKRGYSGRRSGR
jgi:hypothetical protein